MGELLPRRSCLGLTALTEYVSLAFFARRADLRTASCPGIGCPCAVPSSSSFICVKLPGVILRCDHTWAAWEGPCGLPCLPLRCCSCLQCVVLVDRVPGRSTWGSPTTNKHPWTPGGSKGARRLLSVPYRVPVGSR
jgi:hypothetical protein